MSSSDLKRAPLSILVGVLATFVFGIHSCLTHSLVKSVVEEPDLNGIWLDSTEVIRESGGDPILNIPSTLDTSYWVSKLELDGGKFSLTVPEISSGFIVPEPWWGADYPTVDKVYRGEYETRSDSLLLDYDVGSSPSEHIEPFRFQFFSDSLILFYNSDAGIDTVAVRGNPDSVVYMGMIRPQSALWPYMSQKMRGVFKRIEQ